MTQRTNVGLLPPFYANTFRMRVVLNSGEQGRVAGHVISERQGHEQGPMSISIGARGVGLHPPQRDDGMRRSPGIGEFPTPVDRQPLAPPPEAGGYATPGYVNGCFGWLHGLADRAGAAPGGDAAVLLCPALGWDGLHAHHGFRILAERLAAAGYPALRIQYPGTGDSCDLPPSAEHWDLWLRTVHDAADWLKASTGARRLILVGLRLGATLAAAAAADRTDVDGLALLAPVLRGKSYIRQMDMEARLEGGASAEPPAPESGIELHELRFSPQTVERIGLLDLRRTKLRAGLNVAIFSQAPSQLADSCARAWTDGGVKVHCAGFDGLEPLLQEAIHSDPPPPDFRHLLTWASMAAPARHAPDCNKLAPAPSLDLGCCTEAPVRFAGGRLFGILCRPPAGPGRLAVIIANTGRDPRYGIARFGVELARHLAAAGIASLRMDFAGLGDSAAAAGQPDQLSSLFETDRAADIGAAIDALTGMGFSEFAMQGLCSGAYHALRTAQRDRRIGGLLLVNLPVFEWHGGDSVRTAIWTSAPTRRVLQKLLTLSTWHRALHGQAEIRPFLQAQGRRLMDLMRHVLPGLLPAKASPERAMATLAGRGVRSLFLYSAGDPGLDVLDTVLGPGEGGLLTRFGVEIRVVPGIDHILSGRHMRAQVANLMVTFLAANEGRRPDHDDPLDHPRPDGHRRPPPEADAGTPAR